MKRGDIYIIQIPFATGREMRKNRPGVIVSGGELEGRGLLQVVLCSATSEHSIEPHVPIRSTPRPSVAMCEHLYTVDRSRIGTPVGRCTEAELAEIDKALGTLLGLGKEKGADEDIGPYGQ